MDNKETELIWLRKRVDTLSALLEITRVLASTLDLKKLLKYVMSVAGELLQAEGSSVILVDKEKNELYFEIAHGEKADAISEIRMPISHGIAGWVIKEGKSVIVNDVANDNRFKKNVDEKSGFTTKSIIAVPLVIKADKELGKDKIIGCLEVVNKISKDEWGIADLQILEILANQVAIAIENTLLVQKLRESISKPSSV